MKLGSTCNEAGSTVTIVLSSNLDFSSFNKSTGISDKTNGVIYSRFVSLLVSLSKTTDGNNTACLPSLRMSILYSCILLVGNSEVYL